MRIAAIRLAHLIGVLLGVTFLVYVLLDLLPGDTAEVIVASSDTPSAEAVEAVRKSLGLDQPLLERYFSWLGGLLQGDLGQSYRTGETVLAAVADRLPVTLQLLVMAEVVSLAIAIPLATIAANRRDSWIDRVVAVVTFGFQALPHFMVAVLLVFLLAVKLQILPALGFVPLSEDVGESIKSLLIPTLALSAGLIPVYLRILRTEMIRTLQEDYILLARSVGLKPSTILTRYALKPSLPTLITVVGVNIGHLVGGTIVIELICGLPGVGTLLFSSINGRDYVMVQGLILLIASTYVVANFLVDIVYTVLDPRVRA
ncbi:ABC transporter permease [Nocardioides sp. cx-169]|uniref:ABC transporter permease n=1 Tax=Nocardioides sp. cx-169 TaxID=2899080 RepID=UPI001E459802|nr:ABC transporter permease [Nocardioides sp. cx-169]MCD4534320.1 ABC transporter permease [Nocardioides sp. cx-169]